MKVALLGRFKIQVIEGESVVPDTLNETGALKDDLHFRRTELEVPGTFFGSTYISYGALDNLVFNYMKDRVEETRALVRIIEQTVENTSKDLIYGLINDDKLQVILGEKFTEHLVTRTLNESRRIRGK